MGGLGAVFMRLATLLGNKLGGGVRNFVFEAVV